MPPFVATLLAQGLGLLGNAVLNKGKEVIEEKLGVNIEELTQSPEGLQQLRQLEIDNEQFLLTNALENRKIDLDFYKVDAGDRNSARDMGTRTQESPYASWLAKNIVPILALIIVLGGGAGIIWSETESVRSALLVIVTGVVSYYFGTSMGATRTAAAVQTLGGTK